MGKGQGMLQIVKYLMVFNLGLATYWAISTIDTTSDRYEIVYVSQDEIIELEKQRIQEQPLEKRQMFFSRIEEAIKLVSLLAEQYQGATTKVVYSVGTVKGDKVRSISKQVHSAIIKELSKAITNES